MSATAFSNSILRRILDGDGRGLPPEVASFFLGLSLTDTESERIAELSEKANEGEMTPEERDELGMFVLLSDFIAIMQSNARTAMKNRSPAA